MKRKCPDCYGKMYPDEFGEYWECAHCFGTIEMSELEQKAYEKKTKKI